MVSQRSLDAVEYEIYAPKACDTMLPVIKAVRKAERPHWENVCDCAFLDGDWDMVEDGNADRVYDEWKDTIKASVPGSVHAALIESGVIPDPTVEKNDAIACEKSEHTWWLKRSFHRPQGFERTRLVFEGVCDRCTVWLNGRLLGSHQGMFGGPSFEITDLLQDDNELIVMLYPAPFRYERKEGELNDFFDGKNVGWLDTTVFNCVYGWHYANIPALGIWRSVKLERIPTVEMREPFASVSDLSGRVDLCMDLTGPEGGFSGKIEARVKHIGSEKTESFEIPYTSSSMNGKLHAEFTLQEPKLWWPNDLGEQNLYLLELAFTMDGRVIDRAETTFGIRTIEMRPCEEQADERIYNWQFVINGEPIFVKGTNWCTLDFAMRFGEERYDRFLSLAKLQHLQLVRAWGGGMPETETFYRLCDRYGIMVLQEFPTAWDSQKIQPADVLREGVLRTVRRLRGHASLALWGGGNESDHPTDAVIDMMGRIVYEQDGTRVFHRNDPWGGSSHNYSVYWGQDDFDFNLHYIAPFIGEFGFASSPNIESARRYYAAEDFTHWPEDRDGAVAHHTPVFNTKNDMGILHRYIPSFLPDTSLENMIVSTQLCQATAIRNTLELARTRRPQATGICYYKLTDVFPSVSWSTIDWYGVPKMAYYFIQDSYEPLHACLLLNTYQPNGEAQDLAVYLLDDTHVLNGKTWTVRCRAYGADLMCRAKAEWSGVGDGAYNKEIGRFRLDECVTAEAPLLLTIELDKEGTRVGRTFYWLNFNKRSGNLFDLPRTTLKLERETGYACITNTGSVPAVGVHFLAESISSAFTPQDNYFWLEAGETVQVAVDRNNYEGVAAWNCTK